MQSGILAGRIPNFACRRIIYDPRIEPQVANGQRDDMVLSIDLAPTMLVLAGVDIPAAMQGKNMMPLVEQKPVDWRSQFYYQHTYQTGPPRSPIPATERMRTEDWQFVRYSGTVPLYEQLFDRKQDPLEQWNLASDTKYAERLKELRKRCDAAPDELR